MAEAWTLVLSDLYRYAGKTSLKALSVHYVRNRSFRYSFWLRLANSTNPIVSLGARVMHHRLTRKFGIQIQRRTKIGPGLYIGHNMCVVVHPKTVIGANCNLHQFTTIGSNNDTPAIIGDNVYIGPGCSIIENVSIGNGVTIGAGSVVTRDIPANTTAAGVPARPLSENAPGRFIRHPWLGPARGS